MPNLVIPMSWRRRRFVQQRWR